MQIFDDTATLNGPGAPDTAEPAKPKRKPKAKAKARKPAKARKAKARKPRSGKRGPYGPRRGVDQRAFMATSKAAEKGSISERIAQAFGKGKRTSAVVKAISESKWAPPLNAGLYQADPRRYLLVKISEADKAGFIEPTLL